MPDFRTLDDVDVHGKKIVIRLDLNVPVNHCLTRNHILKVFFLCKA